MVNTLIQTLWLCAMIKQKRSDKYTTRSPPSGWARRNATPLCSKTLPIFFNRDIWRRLWHSIRLNATRLNADKAVGCGIYGRFSNIDKYRLEVEAADDIISGLALDYVGMDVPTCFGDCGLNSGRIIRLFILLRTSVQYLIAFCSQPEAISDVIHCAFVGPIVLDKCVKFRGTSLNHSREIPPEAVVGGIFDSSFFVIISDWK